MKYTKLYAKRGVLIYILFLVSLAGCSLPLEPPIPAGELAPTNSPEITSQTTETSILPSLTPLPTITPYPISLPQPPTISICTSGCDFQTIQAAIDHPATVDGDVIGIEEEVHTEAGILVSKSLTIQGSGPEMSIVQAHEKMGEATERVFTIPENVQVTLRDLVIQKGYPAQTPFSGGGIRNQGDLIVENCLIEKNRAGDGGGILNRGTLVIINSTISHNHSDGIGDPAIECGTGGGINNAFQASLMVQNSLITNNVAEGKGGGLHVACEGNATLVKTEISGNKSTRNGGGVFLKGTMTLFDSVITRNSTPADGGGVIVYGTLNYYESVIAGNLTGGNCIIWGDDSYKGKGDVAVESNTSIPQNNCHFK